MKHTQIIILLLISTTLTAQTLTFNFSDTHEQNKFVSSQKGAQEIVLAKDQITVLGEVYEIKDTLVSKCDGVYETKAYKVEMNKKPYLVMINSDIRTKEVFSVGLDDGYLRRDFYYLF